MSSLRPRLTLAINDSDQVRDVLSGRVPVAGIDLTPLVFEAEEIFFRFSRHREWEISELSMAKYTTLRARGEDWLIAIPVFPSRSFRHSAIYIRADGPRDDPGALAGARIGVPEWSVTATVYARALLQHQYGLALDAIQWIQGGTNEPGRVEGIELAALPGLRITPERERSLNAMLLAGDLDAIIAPHEPEGCADRSGRIVRLFSDLPSVESAYHAETGIFPIMHVVVIRRDVHDTLPWLAANLLTAFTAAKDNSVARALDTNVPRLPVPGAPEHAAAAQARFGGDLWPYGLEPNLVTLTAFLGYMAEQGLCEPGLQPAALFAESTLEAFRV